MPQLCAFSGMHSEVPLLATASEVRNLIPAHQLESAVGALAQYEDQSSVGEKSMEIVGNSSGNRFINHTSHHCSRFGSNRPQAPNLPPLGVSLVPRAQPVCKRSTTGYHG